MPDAGDVGEQVVVSGILEAVLAAMDSLDEQTQVILAFRFHRGFELSRIAELLGITEQRVVELHNAGVQAVHTEMIKAVT